MSHAITRRSFLVRSATVTGGVLVLSLDACGGGGGSDEEVRVRISDLLPSEAATVGKAWKKAAEEDEPGALLIADLRQRGVDLQDPGAIGDAVREMIREDFATGRTAEVNQWLLAATEGRLCALAS